MAELTLILVNYHSQKPLGRFFDSLDRHPIAASHEVIVVDNAPGDGAAQWLARRAPHVRVISMGRNTGYARAVNAGLAAGSGRALLVINPDVELSEGAVDTALAYLDAHPESGLVGARLLNPDGTVQHSARRFYTLTTILLRRTPLSKLLPSHPALREHLMLDDDLTHARPVDWVTGAWMLVRRSAVERVGPMDGRFFLYFEDVDWCYRMWAGGYEVHYLPETRFVHQYQRSSGRMGKTLVYHLRSFLSYYDKWGALVYVAKHMRPGWETFSAVAADVVALNAAFLAAFSLRRALDPLFPEALFDLSDYLPLVAFTNLVALVTLPLLGRYRSPQPQRAFTRWLSSVRAALLVALVVMSGTFLSHTRTFSRAVVLMLAPLQAIALQLAVLLRQRILAGGRDAVRPVTRAALVGSGGGVVRLRHQLSGATAAELVVAGAITPSDDQPDGVRWLGPMQQLPELVERFRIEEVLVDSGETPDERLLAALRELAATGLPVLLHHPWAVALVGEEGTPLRYGLLWSHIRPPAACAAGSWSKGLLDRPVGLLLCLFALPGFMLCCLLGIPLRLVSVRTVRRVALRRRLLAWRELVWRRTGAPLWGVVQLPLFLQVLAGRLSLVGPYPLPVGVDEELGPIQLLRFTVKPGLSGFWQRKLSEPTLRQLIGDDLEYLDRWSLMLDLDLFLSGLPQLMGSGTRWHRAPTAT